MDWLRDLATGTPQWVYTVGWAVWIVSFVALETWALLDRGPDDTLTENIRPVLQSTSFGWFLAAGFFAWLFWHFVVER